MKKFFHLIKANIKKEYIEMKRYWPNTLSMVLTIYFIFLAMFLGIQFVGDPNQADTNIQYVIVNYIFWYLTLITLQGPGFTITLEATRGTLEQLYMSPMGVWKIFLSRQIGTVIIHFFIIVVLLFASMLMTNQWLNISPLATLPIFLFTIIGMIGVSFIIAGLAIIVKQIQAFLQIMQFILMALTFIPLSVAPFLAYAPFVKGIDMIRQIMIHNMTLADFTWLDYALLIASAAFYFAIGIFTYLRCEKIAMEKGLLGQY
ncbi:ABC-2 type transport system permease protein [Melghiribacillus thermohalophilus]|uniref:ABC-2 type transport system permease protein n=1 Tax=Melghiribacillus thermohalophilus TaxID=1324956 RepID=A0A4R3MVY2_9BACI|nr:ABC transporter permease [Melghiribacillus thermohalophilus]TCT19666.1 ABC-2 type transport system permease protein [Melghiribacillus thermohalophilus]